MKKQNKLARNTIKLRKAQNKRKDEPNKPKPKQSRKRLASRIVALFGCLLLVSALVVPCFAAFPNSSDGSFEGIYQGYMDEAENHYRELFSNSTAYYNFRDANPGDWITFAKRYDCLMAGNLSTDLTGALHVESMKLISPDDSYEEVAFQSTFAGAVVSIYGLLRVNQSPIINYYSSNTDIQIYMLDYGGPDEPVLEVKFLYDGDEEICSLLYWIVNNRYQLSQITVYGQGYSIGSFVDIGVCIGFPSVGNMNYVSQLSSLLFSNIEVVFPKTDAYGFLSAYNLGKELSSRLERNAYDQGVADGGGGYSSGYDTGYSEGYGKAVSEISSGDYGRNLLGNALTAPFNAVTGIELVSWTLESGTQISITVGTIFSTFVGIALFIWFLKMFAGG